MFYIIKFAELVPSPKCPCREKICPSCNPAGVAKEEELCVHDGGGFFFFLIIYSNWYFFSIVCLLNFTAYISRFWCISFAYFYFISFHTSHFCSRDGVWWFESKKHLNFKLLCDRATTSVLANVCRCILCFIIKHSRRTQPSFPHQRGRLSPNSRGGLL